MSFRVAIAGCGYFARYHRDAWRRLDGIAVTGVCDIDPARAAAAAAEFPGAAAFVDLDTMLDRAQPHVLDIVTPPATHLAAVDAAGRRGIDAICQKPLADDLAGARAIVAAAERHGIRLVVHENFRFMPWFAEARRVIESGALGTVLNIAFRLRPGDGQGPNAPFLARQPYFKDLPRFLVHETAIHLVDAFRMLLGEVTGVFARLRRYNPAIRGEDAGIVVIDFASGALGVIDANRHLDHPADDTRLTMGVMHLEGTRGSLRLDGFGRLFFKPHGEPERPHDYAWTDRGFGGDCVHRQITHALAHLRDGAPVVNDARSYLRNIEIEEAIYLAADERRFVAL
ncbi:MAG: Gfo/Idh/MocA family oxidoreductase [Alphaproteobacteria bacterium]|nr:Gfo/Idh/MocA family oxidoreductase [Alphaproteobacteria bacterium]